MTGDSDYEGASGERWKRIGRAVFGERAHAPVTTHPIGMHWPWESFRNEKWLDFIIYQSGHGDEMIRCVGFTPGLPVGIGMSHQLDRSLIWNHLMKATWAISHASRIAITAPGGRFTGAF